MEFVNNRQCQISYAKICVSMVTSSVETLLEGLLYHGRTLLERGLQGSSIRFRGLRNTGSLVDTYQFGDVCPLWRGLMLAATMATLIIVVTLYALCLVCWTPVTRGEINQ